MKIEKAGFPKNSTINVPQKEYDYVDGFKGEVSDPNKKISSVDVGYAFFSSGPKWVSKLFAIRNRIVSLFGLKTSGSKEDKEQEHKNFRCEPGDRLGLFKVFAKTENEIILGEDDKHLDFRVSLFLEESVGDPARKSLTVSTTVKFNNWLGRLYFFPVRLFHKMVVPAMLKGIIAELEKQNA